MGFGADISSKKEKNVTDLFEKVRTDKKLGLLKAVAQKDMVVFSCLKIAQKVSLSFLFHKLDYTKKKRGQKEL